MILSGSANREYSAYATPFKSNHPLKLFTEINILGSMNLPVPPSTNLYSGLEVPASAADDQEIKNLKISVSADIRVA